MKQNIVIRIGGNSYDMTVKSPEEEQLMRNAAVSVNSAIGKYQEKFPQRDILDILSFVALRQCMNNLILKGMREEDKKEGDELKELLKSYLDNIEK